LLANITGQATGLEGWMRRFQPRLAGTIQLK
jgi:hypothetical protein